MRDGQRDEPAARGRRVLLVSANFRPSVGGVERFVEILGEGLAGRGWEVAVLCCRHEDAPLVEQAGGMRIVRVPSSHLLKRRWNVPYPLPSPLPLVRETRRLVAWADIVHAQDALYATSFTALVIARTAGVPAVLTQHVGFVPQASRVLDAGQRAAIGTLGRAARLASRVVAYNADVATWARTTWRLQKVDVLPSGIPDPGRREDTDPGVARRALGLPEDRFLALFVGRDVPKKRVDLALAAADPAYEIVAVTDRVAPAPDGTRILPFLPPDRFRDLLLSADAFVLPSEAEGIPLALQEALAAGLPCVVTRVPGYERYLRDGDVLWVAPDASSIRAALRSLVSDAALRARLARRARAAGIREFGLDRFLDAYETLYSETIASAHRT